MLTRTAHKSVWSTHSYICLACRLETVQLYHRQQRRQNGGVATPATNGGDSWFDTINDISDNYGSIPPSPLPNKNGPEKNNEGAKGDARPEGKTKPAQSSVPKRSTRRYLTDGGKPSSVRYGPGPRVLEHGIVRNREASDPWTDPPRDRGVEPEDDINEIMKDLEPRRKTSTLSSTRAERQTESQSFDLTVSATRDGVEVRVGLTAVEDVLRRGRRDTRKRLTRGRRTAKSSLGSKISGRMRSKAVEDLKSTEILTARLQSAAKQNAVEEDAKLDGQRDYVDFDAKKESPSIRPFPTFQNTVRVPAGKTKQRVEADATISETPNSLWKARTSPKASGLGGSLTERTDLQPSTSLAARFMETRTQTRWGRSSTTNTCAKATFNSLRKADKAWTRRPFSAVTEVPFHRDVFVSSLVRPNGSAGAEQDNFAKSAEPVLEEAFDTSTEAAVNQDAEEKSAHPEQISPEARVEHNTEEEAAEPLAPSALERLLKLSSSRAKMANIQSASSLQGGGSEGQSIADAMGGGNANGGNRGRGKGSRLLRTVRRKNKTPLARRVPSRSRLTAEGQDQSEINDEPEPLPAQSVLELEPELESLSKVEQTAAINAFQYTIDPDQLEITPLNIAQPPVPYLSYGLDRVLFNPGVYQLQDPGSRVYNFDPYLQQIMPVAEFDFNSLKQYKTSSQDEALAALASDHGSKFVGSTSSMTSTLAHFHYLLSNFRPLNLDMLSRSFTKEPSHRFTKINKAPSAIFLKKKGDSYAIDADKEYDSANVLMLLGKSMELLLTLPKDEYEKYRKSDPRSVPMEAKTAPEAYQYTTMGDFLMRSQLDAFDPRLPGNGTFDLKTRAVVSVRMQAHDHEPMTGYEIFSSLGPWSSYEREYYDMIRSTMLKYMLQARMGRMNGIFVAYHNVKRIFGFQYIPMHDMDRALHGQTDRCLGDHEFKISLKMLNEVLNKATEKFPDQSLRLHFEAQESNERAGMPASLHVFAEPMEEEAIDRIQNSQKDKIKEWERTIMGMEEGESSELIEEDVDSVEVTAMPAGARNEVTEQASEATLDDAAVDEAQHLVEIEGDNDGASSCANMQVGLDSTEPNADSAFLKKLELEASEELKPLFYASIITLSAVNGDRELSNSRPEKLKAEDKWEVEYLVREYETTRYHWALYEDMKARRKMALWQEVEEEDLGDSESEVQNKKSDSYINFLRQLSQRGEVMREKIDEAEAGKEMVRVEQPLPMHREKIRSLEDYMAWMYDKEMRD